MSQRRLARFSLPYATASDAPLERRLLLGLNLAGLRHQWMLHPMHEGRPINGYRMEDRAKDDHDAAGDGLSTCERLELQGSPFAGIATVFVSWSLNTTFYALLEALDHYLTSNVDLDVASTFFWISLFSIRQAFQNECKPDLLILDGFSRVIEATMHTVLMLDPWKSPAQFSRTWLLWELYLTYHAGARFGITMSASEVEDFQRELGPNLAAALSMIAKRVDVAKTDSGWSSPQQKQMFMDKLHQLNGADGMVVLNHDVVMLLQDGLQQLASDIVTRQREAIIQIDGRADESEANNSVTSEGRGQLGGEVVARYVKLDQTYSGYLPLDYRDVLFLVQHRLVHCPNPNNITALDFRCGSGRFTRFLRSCPGISRVCGADSAVTLIQEAKTADPGNEQDYISCETSSHVPLKTGSVDLVVSLFGLMELPDKSALAAYFAEATRCLRTGGVFIAVTTIEASYDPRRFCKNMRHLLGSDYDPYNPSLAPRAKVTNYIFSAGLCVEDHFWRGADYRREAEDAGLQLAETHTTLGKAVLYFEDAHVETAQLAIYVWRKPDCSIVETCDWTSETCAR